MNTKTRWIVILTGIGSFMAALDTVVVGTALTAVRESLGASLEQVEWTVNAYNLAFGMLIVTGAALGDRFGRRRAYASGLLLFALASAACALAPGPEWLVAARALQGVGAALVMPVGLALLTAAFPPERRGAAIGMFSAITGVAVACGPLVGGAIADGLDWGWIFWLNVPVGVAAAALVVHLLDESHGTARRLDVVGLVLGSAAALGLVWGLVRGNAAGWSSGEVLGAAAAGVSLLVAFLAWERRAAEPMVPLGLFRSRGFSAGNAAIFCTFGSLFACVFFLPQLLQVALGDSPLRAGLHLLVWTGTFITVAPVVGALVDRHGERPFMLGGLALQAAGIGWLAATVSTSSSYGDLVIPFVVAGVGISMAIPAAQSSVVGTVTAREAGTAAGVNSMMREVGGVLGIALAAAAFAQGGGHYGSPSAFIDGLSPALTVASAIAVVGAACGALLPARSPERLTPIEQELTTP